MAVDNKFVGTCLVFAMVAACDGAGDAGSEPGELEERAGHHPQGQVCEPVDLDPRRAIFETNVAVLEPFTLRAVLHHAAKNAGYKIDAEDAYQRLIDTYATSAQGRFDGQHCDDEQPDPSFTDPSLPCGLLGCDQEFFCAAHEPACFVCAGDGHACQPNTGLEPGIHEICGFGFDGPELCSFDGRHVTDCVPAPDGACDDAGCDALGCDAVTLCDPSFELCITCSAELDQCRVDQGTADDPIETVCRDVDACQFDVDAGTVSGCEPDPECELAQCGPLGCDQEFFCTTDFQFCFACSGDHQQCELDGQAVPSPSQVCDFSTNEVCSFEDGTIQSCGTDTEGVCFGGGGGDGGTTSDSDTFASFGFIGGEVGGEVGGEETGTTFVDDGGSFTGGGDGGSATATSGATFGDTFGDGTTTFGDDGGGDDGGGGGGAAFGAINGYPLECPRIEANQIDNIDAWFPISISNRFDHAPEDGSNCGQQRIVFANNAQNRMFMIFEAVIPNPSPGCGIEACRPVVEFWANMNDITDVDARRRQLKKAFLTGHPKLEAAGFGPFVDARNYSFGSGQIRTNNFDQDPWTLREYKLVEQPRPGKKSLMHAAQVPVTYSPIGDHFNDALDTPLGPECRESFLVAMEGLLTDEPDAMSFPIDPMCRAAESRDDGVSDFAQQLVLGTGVFEAAIESRLDELGSPLTAIDIAQRAHFAGACIGCHEQSNGADLGNGVVAPFSAGFTHTVEFFTEECFDGEQCFAISDALTSSFLPHRKAVMESFLASTPCQGQCSYEVGHGHGHHGDLAAGPIDVRRALTHGGKLDVRRMIDLEQRARATGAKRTLGGQSTLSGH